mgnify:CR=1 FL=1
MKGDVRMSKKLVDQERLARLAKALDDRAKAAVKAEVERRLAGAAPKGNGSAASTPAELTKEAALKLSMEELNKLAETQPDVFKKLFG